MATKGDGYVMVHITPTFFYSGRLLSTANVLLEVEDIVPHRFYYYIQAKPGFEANGVEVQLHVDVRIRQNAGTRNYENKIREILCSGPSAKIYALEIYPLYGTRVFWVPFRLAMKLKQRSNCCTLIVNKFSIF